MTKGIFITGTGTDVGKTYISALIVKKLKADGYNCGYYKPVLSGAEIQNEEIIAGDCQQVINCAQIDAKSTDLASYVFKTPVSPHLASKLENISIDIDKIKNDFANIKAKYDYILVEGAGGIICPINIDKNTMLTDIIKMLNLDIIIVANAGLGTINSTVLTVEYAKSKNINVKGIILNNFEKNNFMHIDNKKQIEALTNIKIIAEVEKNATDIDNIANLFGEI